jgi:glycosyltransferase 2 family protein
MAETQVTQTTTTIESLDPRSPGNNEPAKKKNRLWTIVKIVVSTALLAILISQVNWKNFLTVAASISLVYIIYPLVAYYVNVGLSVFKWRTFLEYLTIIDRFGKLYMVYMIGAYYNNFLPSTIGGDGYRFLKIRADHPGKSEQIFSSILLERGFGYLILIVVNVILAAWFWKFLSSQTWLLLIEIGLAAALAIGGILWLFRYRFPAILPDWKFLKKLEQFLHMIDIQNWRVLFIAVGTSLLFVLISGVWLGVYYWAVGVQVNWLYIIYVSTLMNIIGAIPITLNGLGIVELVQVRMMGLVGIPIETVLVVSIMTRVMLILLSLPGGILSFR